VNISTNLTFGNILFGCLIQVGCLIEVTANSGLIVFISKSPYLTADFAFPLPIALRHPSPNCTPYSFWTTHCRHMESFSCTFGSVSSVWVLVIRNRPLLIISPLAVQITERQLMKNLVKIFKKKPLLKSKDCTGSLFWNAYSYIQKEGKKDFSFFS